MLVHGRSHSPAGSIRLPCHHVGRRPWHGEGAGRGRHWPLAQPGSPCSVARQANPQARGQHLALPGQSVSWVQGSWHGRSVPGGGLAGQAPGFTGDSSERSGTGSSSPASPTSPDRAHPSEHRVRGPPLCHSSVPRGGCSPTASPLVPKPQPCPRCSSHPVSPAGAAGRHWRPQLLLQHFCASGQSLSPWHCSRHGPAGPGCAAGHSPGLGWPGGAQQARGFSIPNRLPCPPRDSPAPRCDPHTPGAQQPHPSVGFPWQLPGAAGVGEVACGRPRGPWWRGGGRSLQHGGAPWPPRSEPGLSHCHAPSRPLWKPYSAPAPGRQGRSPAGSTSALPGSPCLPGRGRSRGRRGPRGPPPGRRRVSLQCRVAWG